MKRETYGFHVGNDVDQGSIELLGFAHDGPLGRYQHCRNAIDLIWNTYQRDTFIWNDWSEMMMEAFCSNRYVTVTGPGACVSGDTKILNPLTGEKPTIAELHERNEAPIVLTRGGPYKAGVPFIKGIEELYEVVLSDGSKFKSTAGHRVMLASGDYACVGSLATGSRLLGYGHVLRESNLDICRSAHVSDEVCSQKKEQGFRFGCLPDFYSYDEQLPRVEAYGQEIPPSHAGVQEHIRLWQREFSHIPPESQFVLPSSLDFSRQSYRPEIRVSRRVLEENVGHDACLFLLFEQWQRENNPHSPSVNKDQDCVPLHSFFSDSCLLMEHVSEVVSITRTNRQVYYDISVPIEHHYFAEGAIHHNSWKTTTAAMYALVCFFASPSDTVVIVTSTTLDGLRRRVWKEISKFYRLRPAIGNMIQSRNCIQFQKGMDDAGIFGLATDKGEIDKAIGKIIGFHAKNMIVEVDEMPYTPEAIVEASVNLETGAKHFQFIGLGNAADHLDPHGRMCEPKNGWDSISEESEKWETKRGICLHLDGIKSPNIVNGRKDPGLIQQKDIDTTIELYGVDSPQFWQMRRGFWCPEGVQKTVLTMPMIVRGRAKEKAVFDVDYVTGASLDPAFEGGDRCVLRKLKCGNENGKKVMELCEKVFIKTVQSVDDPLHYQISRQVKQKCEEWGVPPFMFALDSTGEGGGLASIIQREWSREILCVEFGGRPSKSPVSQTNPKREDQEYDREVSALWFFFRLLVQNEQVRGLDDDTATEFCRRWYQLRGAYISLETKAIMKERTRMSPDLADNAVVGAKLFKLRANLKLAKVSTEVAGDTSWSKFQKKRSLEAEYETVAY